MSLNIKNEEAHRLAKELSSLTGETMSDAVITALKLRLQLFTSQAPLTLTQKLLEIASDCRGRWKEPWLESDHGELLYDDAGVPK